MQDRFVFDGWLFVNFIAMLAYFKLFDRLRQKKLLKKTSPSDVLSISKGIYQNWNQWKRWVRTEIAQKNLKLFTKLDVDPLKNRS
jgi:hypothetical protein